MASRAIATPEFPGRGRRDSPHRIGFPGHAGIAAASGSRKGRTTVASPKTRSREKAISRRDAKLCSRLGPNGTLRTNLPGPLHQRGVALRGLVTTSLGVVRHPATNTSLDCCPHPASRRRSYLRLRALGHVETDFHRADEAPSRAHEAPASCRPRSEAPLFAPKKAIAYVLLAGPDRRLTASNALSHAPWSAATAIARVPSRSTTRPSRSAKLELRITLDFQLSPRYWLRSAGWTLSIIKTIQI